MKTNTELFMTAYERTGQAHVGLHAIHDLGTRQPVPATLFTQTLVQLREATAAVTELERRAQGGAIPKEG